MKVRLTRKLADCLDGIDVSNHRVGDVLELSPTEARLLMAENWAMPERRQGDGVPPGAERRQAEPAHRDESTLDVLGRAI